MIEILQVKCLSASGHYFVFCGDPRHAFWKWGEVYPAIDFSTVTVTSEVLY